MSARIKDEREHCCDDLAIQLTQKPLGYAKTLIHLKEKEMKITPKAAVAFVGHQPQGFKQRITRLVSGYFRSATYGEGIITALILILMMGTAVFASQYNSTNLTELPNEASITPPEVDPPMVDTPFPIQDVDVDYDFDPEDNATAEMSLASTEFDLPASRIPLTDFEQQRYNSAIRRRELRLVLAGRLKPEDAVHIKEIF